MFRSKIAVGLIAAVLMGLVSLPSQPASADPLEGVVTVVEEAAAEVSDVESGQLVTQAGEAVEDATDTTAEASEGVKNRRVAVCVAILGAITAVVCEIISQLPG